mgnify:CR=1 FL=1
MSVEVPISMAFAQSSFAGKISVPHGMVSNETEAELTSDTQDRQEQCSKSCLQWIFIGFRSLAP